MTRPHRQTRLQKHYHAKNKMFYPSTLPTRIYLKSLTSLWNVVEKKGNFCRQTHYVNFHNVTKISANL